MKTIKINFKIQYLTYVKLLLIFQFIAIYAFGQKDTLRTKNSLSYQVGYGLFENNKFSGHGGIIGFGYKRSIWKNKLRINPNFQFGSFNNKWVMDAIPNSFNTYDLNSRISFDALRYKSISIVLDAGGFVNYSSGIKGEGVWVRTEPQYLNMWNYGVLFSGGMRINPQFSRFAIDLIPANWYIGTNGLYKYFFNLGLDIKL